MVDVARQQGFTALLAAATKADLASALSAQTAQLTVFAPTDAAFNQLATKLGFTDANAMVAALPAAALKSILNYHVLPSIKTSAALAGTTAQSTAYSFDNNPAALKLDTSNGVKITDGALTTANVTTADVAAGNGVIHVIDKVLIPPGVLNIVQLAKVNPNLSSLATAVGSANLATALSGTGPFTVFAPTNAAFAAAPAGLSAAQLATVLKYHVVNGQVLASGIPFGAPVSTLAQQAITIKKTASGGAAITDTTGTPANIVATDVRASNGVVHVIDKVLIPAL
ncbi:fasciclin domain-containing protein [Oxalobacteraceae bacterium OM1]|nr:fasciclin domain-containing protein [Oxalobacteraceae bacterium OM1]